MDVGTMIGRKDKIVKQFTGGIAHAVQGQQDHHVLRQGQAAARATTSRSPARRQRSRRITRTNVILASGSVPIELPFAKFDGKHIVDNVGALDFTEVPKRLGVIGAGVIGLELGSVWKPPGCRSHHPRSPARLPRRRRRGSRQGRRCSEFKKQGLDIKLGAKVTKAEVKKNEVHVTYTDKDGDHELVVDKLLVAVGRRASTEGLLADGTGVKLDERGRIEVDEHCHTGVDGVWAVGDCVRGPMLAHKGFEEGIAVAELIAGLPGHVNFDTIPWVIYTEPEIAWVGKTEQQLKDEGMPYKAGSFPFAAIGRAVAMDEAGGFVKVIAHAETDRILGMHMVGAGVSELVARRRAGDGVQGLGRRPGAHLPRAPDPVRSRARCGHGGRQARDPQGQLSAWSRARSHGRRSWRHGRGRSLSCEAQRIASFRALCALHVTDSHRTHSPLRLLRLQQRRPSRVRRAGARLRREMARRGIALVYGGGKVGLMGTVADAVLAGGGQRDRRHSAPAGGKEVAHPGLTELQVVETMHERKTRMYELSRRLRRPARRLRHAWTRCSRC